MNTEVEKGGAGTHESLEGTTPLEHEPVVWIKNRRKELRLSRTSHMIHKKERKTITKTLKISA